jgi:hypothetical protein
LVALAGFVTDKAGGWQLAMLGGGAMLVNNTRNIHSLDPLLLASASAFIWHWACLLDPPHFSSIGPVYWWTTYQIQHSEVCTLVHVSDRMGICCCIHPHNDTWSISSSGPSGAKSKKNW